jgi:hypothetical protein
MRRKKGNRAEGVTWHFGNRDRFPPRGLMIIWLPHLSPPGIGRSVKPDQGWVGRGISGTVRGVLSLESIV